MLPKKIKCDVCIVGAGPAGIACALLLANTNLRIAIIDKANFPRDKICGDALSLDVITQLSKISANLAQSFEEFKHKTASFGVQIFSPGGNSISIPFIKDGIEKCGYICKRKDFDKLLFDELKKCKNVDIFENRKIKNAQVNNDTAVINTLNETFECKMIIGADGAHSYIAKKLADTHIDRNHYCSGLRMYYDNVKQISDKNFIELYFFKDVLPGYVWVFPLPGNQANVGIGVLSSTIVKKKINLTKTFIELIENNNILKKRLEGALSVDKPIGYSLPLGSIKRTISGNRFLLLGDAAGLIDPFTGEGVANAIRSGRVAAEHIIKNFANNDFSVTFNMSYDKEIYARMWKEFQISATLQKLSKYESLFNLVVNAANHNKSIKQFITKSMANIDQKSLLTKWISMQRKIK